MTYEGSWQASAREPTNIVTDNGCLVGGKQ